MSTRHPFHSICPYFAMFPEQFVEQQLLSFTSPGDLVFDPFCGRGTTVFESLLKQRRAAGSDVNPVAACIASAKAAAPSFASVVSRINSLEEHYEDRSVEKDDRAPTEFFNHCYEKSTLREILFVRSSLDWRKDSVDCFIGAVMLGILHGESHRSIYCLSNRMPRTISTKPDYSIRWWTQRGMTAPRRPVFETLRKAVAFRFRMPPAERQGVVKQCDARQVGTAFADITNEVRLVVTSPPYLDTTDYSEDQWLRLWFLGGEPRPELRKSKDDRYTKPDDYWTFLHEAWAGLNPLMADESTIVVRIGGAKFSKESLFEGLCQSFKLGFVNHSISPLHKGLTSSIRPRETSAFRPAPPRANVEHDFVFHLRRNDLVERDQVA